MPAVVVATAYGGPEVLSIVDEPTPEPGPGQAVVSVRAAGVNPADYKTYSGMWGTDPAALPLRLGFEAAGVVTAVGPDVDSVAVGDEVIAYSVSGAYAAEIVAHVGELTPKPSSLSWEQAGGLLLTGATAVHAITAAGVEDGQTVLIHGGAGGVGQMAVQLARRVGARVIATASPARHDALRELGAEPVEYGSGLADRVRALAPEGVDAALDLVGTDEAVDTSLALVADRRRIVSIAAFGRGPEAGIQLLGGGAGADPGTAIRSAARADLARWAGAGELTVTVAGTYPFADVADAHRELMAGHATGKIVLLP